MEIQLCTDFFTLLQLNISNYELEHLVKNFGKIYTLDYSVPFLPTFINKSFVLFIDCFIALKLYAAAGEGQTKK